MHHLQTTIANWQKEHFILFIFVFVSLADNEIIYTEWDMMKEKINGLSEHIDYSVAFVDVSKVFQRCNDAEVLEVIDTFKTRFQPTQEEIQELLKSAEEIVGSDDEVRAEEQQILLILKRALS